QPDKEPKSIHKVTIKAAYDNHTVFDIFKDIESKTEFFFTYDKNDPFLNKKFSKSQGKYSVGHILDGVAAISDIAFQQVNNNISVRKIAKASDNASQEQINKVQTDRAITGKVTDEAG